MSYRSLKRYIGETSLERKCRFLFGACLLSLIIGSFLWYGKITENLVFKQNPTRGRILVDTILMIQHWKELDAYIEPRHQEQYFDLVEDLSSRESSEDYEYWFLRPIGKVDQRESWRRDDGRAKQSAKRYPAKRQATKLAKLDRFDLEVVDAFLDDPSLTYQGRELPDESQFDYYQPIYAQRGCVGCHNTANREDDEPLVAEGDLMSVAKVRISNGPTQSDLNRNRAFLLSTAIITVFLAMVAAWVIVRYVIVKPLKHLRDVSDAISKGDMQQRAEIRTADEFEELGNAFNRMLRHLVAAQEELRQVNGNLDSKVDELAQVNMRLFELNRLKSDFLATMSHELRTPLNSIIGFSDVLGQIKSLDDKQKRYVQNIQKSGKVLLDMINDILDLAKVESGKMELRLSHFRIEQVLAAQCDMARPLTERKNIDLETEIEPRLPELYQDQGKVQQILNNLLSNAIKFTPEGGRIVVAAGRSPADELMLVVADTGVGISEADQSQIFEKFRQGRTVMPTGDAMTREFSGTGLGLSIVKELCKLLGGSVSLESDLGKGSVFTVRLPWTLADQAPADSAPVEPLDALTRPRREDYVRPVPATAGRADA